jgi:hypothetical protein
MEKRAEEAQALRARRFPGFVKMEVDLEALDTTEMADVPRHQLEAMMDRGRGDLQVRIGEQSSLRFELGTHATEDERRRNVVGQDRYGSEHTLLDVSQMSFPMLRTERALVQLADHDGAAELLIPRNAFQPRNVGWQGALAQKLGDRVRVEEVRHEVSIQVNDLSRTMASTRVDQLYELFRVLPPAGEACQPSLGSGGAQSLDLLEIIGRDDGRHGLSVASDDDRPPALCRPEDGGKSGLGFGD